MFCPITPPWPNLTPPDHRPKDPPYPFKGFSSGGPWRLVGGQNVQCTTMDLANKKWTEPWCQPNPETRAAFPTGTKAEPIPNRFSHWIFDLYHQNQTVF
jgi:hypothetical protein